MAARSETQDIGRQTRPRAGRLLGDVIVELGFCDRDTVERVVGAARACGRPMGQLLLEQQHLRADQLAIAIAGRFGLKFVDLGVVEPDAAALNMISAAMMHRLDAVPIGLRDDGTLNVAMVDPGNLLVTDDIAMLTNRSVVPVVVTREDLDRLLARAGRRDGPADDPEEEREEMAAAISAPAVQPSDDDRPSVKLVHSLMAEALDQGASSVHLDPDQGDLLVRYRVDGIMRDITRIPGGGGARMISAIKILSQLDIAERRACQDGRMTLTREGRRIDIQVVTVPLVSGESAVLRGLDPRNPPLSLDGLGIDEADRLRVETALHRGHGAIVVAGPRGSGTSTTLHASVGAVSTPQRTIMTIEDPVEHRLDRVGQIQVCEAAGVTFAAGLRSAMSADPDIIMVGELCDSDTAELAIEAALTGYLLLSSLHANSAAAVPERLIDMGITPYLVATSLEAVIAQRLVRRLCTHCRDAIVVPGGAVGLEHDAADVTVYESVGCVRCSDTGYCGRTGIYEVMTVTDEIRSLITARVSASQIKRAAIEGGMRSLRAAGLAKVRAGDTSLAEVARVTN